MLWADKKKTRIRETLNILTCEYSITDAKRVKKNQENLIHCGPAPPRNTLLNMDLPRRRSVTAEHPTHHRHAPPRNTLLTIDLPHQGTP